MNLENLLNKQVFLNYSIYICIYYILYIILYIIYIIHICYMNINRDYFSRCTNERYCKLVLGTENATYSLGLEP